MKNLLAFLFLFTFSIFAQNSTYHLVFNRLRIPIDNKGILGNVLINGEQGGKLDDKGFLFSGGFYLSGKIDDSLWANAVASASLIEDYLPGNVDSLSTNPIYKIYVVKKDDQQFGNSWIDWKNAVSVGADFYDGNNDGIYNPIDVNGNYLWDPDEDKPDMIGDITTWCVYNDGVPKTARRFLQDPLGIEIHQSVFGFQTNFNFDARANTFFVRYKIINTSKAVQILDSVYFGGWADTDIGELNGAYDDDLAGSDTIHNAGYIYNEGDDLEWGADPPAHFIQILQGPASYIPGVTFIDNNSNGRFDLNVDTVLDTAFNFQGANQLEKFLGAKNQDISSFVHYMSSHPTQGDPYFLTEARNYMLGLNRIGIQIDPFTWEFGNVLGGVNCADVNPHFMYSGDPVNQVGWINAFSTDQRAMVNTGPFELEVGKPINIIVAHVAGRGANALNSVTVGKQFCGDLLEYLNSNFSYIPVDVDDETNFLLNNFRLEQNYPNPFNPTTKISWQSPSAGHQSLKVFDVLGNEVATLVNEYRNAGSYEVDFNASKLSSGVYFYRLQAGSFIETKKMILLK